MGTRFIVTGTGRSGTGYAASLFNAAGMPCGHEALYTDKPGWGEQAPPRQGVLPRMKEPLGRAKESLRRRRSPLAGDASWMAAPRLAAFDGVSFLQLRHPLLVVRSFVGTRFFSVPEAHLAQWRYARCFFEPSGDDVVDAMEWWILWNGLAARHATMVYSLEGIDESVFTRMLTLIDVPSAGQRASLAMSEVPSDVNSATIRGEVRGTMGWEDLPEGSTKERLARAAVDWGYVPDDPTDRSFLKVTAR